MELLNKWLKSPLFMSAAVALILFPCALYTYSLFYRMTKEESASSFVHNAQIKQLTLVTSLQDIAIKVERLKTQISQFDELKSKAFISHFNANNPDFNVSLSSMGDARISLSIPGNKEAVFKKLTHEGLSLEPSESYLTSNLYIDESESLLAISQQIFESKGSNNALIAMINLSQLLPQIGVLETNHDGLCLALYSVQGPRKLQLYDSAAHTQQCELKQAPLRQRLFEFDWMSNPLSISIYDSRLGMLKKTMSLTNILALVLALMSITIIFYIYRSRRYEHKIESLLKERGQSLKEVQTEYSKLFMLSVDGIYRASLSGNLLKANPAYALSFGYLNENDLCNRVNNIGEQLHRDPEQYLNFIERLEKEGRVVGFEWQSHDLKGKSIWLLENAYLTRHENGEVYYEGIIADITQKKITEARLKTQAQMDSLTGLLNRATFVNKMSDFMSQKRSCNSAIFFIDLDKFKTVNDQYGHHVGDELLIEFAKRLNACFEGDHMISRLGGDEFAVFLKQVSDLAQLHVLADKVVAGLRKPFAFSNGCNFKMSASIGISMLDAEVKSASEGLKQADMAMYEVKRNGRADFIIFNQGLNESERRRSILEKGLLKALKHGEIHINYQPIVCFESGAVKGMEALMRWHNDELGDISPVEFIPIAEQINLINPFSNWLIHQVCHDLRQLINTCGNDELFVSINISPKQLLSDQVCDNLLMSLEVNQLSSKHIKLEITETAIYDQEESVVRQLRRIRSYGIGIYIDDFGTGYSSLERLIQYPFDGLKIDRSFVKNLVPGNSQEIILKASVKMAEMLNLVVVVEGIESHFQYDFFRDQSCQYAQGFLLHKPLSVTDLTSLLSKKPEQQVQGKATNQLVI